MGFVSRLREFAFGDDAPVAREIEPRLASALPAVERSTPDEWWAEFGSVNSVTGVHVNQYTSLNSTAVMSCVTMLAEDVAKLPWSIYKNADGETRKEAKDHFLYNLLQEPNDWMNGFELREMMQVGLILRGNAYAVIKRNLRGIPIMLIPVNPDWIALWESPDGGLFYQVSPHGLHQMAMLRGLPDLIPAADVLHIRGFSTNGLVGLSRITAAREAIALSLAQEQQAARWMGNAAKPSGMLTTDQKLGTDAAKRLAEDFKNSAAGLQNSGKVIVGEQGLKFQQFGMTSSDLEFIASRSFQLEEIGRIFRIPQHMLGHLMRSTNNNISQQAQEYINYTLTGYTNRWQEKMAQCFGLRKFGLTIEFDYRALTLADMTSRINNWRTMVMSMIGAPDEARIDLGLDPMGGDAALLQHPSNMAAGGSQSTGNQDGGGRPPGSAEGDQPQA